MDGIIFYWTFWLYWTLSTFFMKKDERRLIISSWILLAIILSIDSLEFLGFEFSITSLFMLFTTYLIMVKQKKRIKAYLFLTSFILMLSYATFRLFELFDPVWLIFNRNWMLAVLLTYLTVIMHKSPQMRLTCLAFGVIHADILYAVILRKYSFAYSIGSFMVLDVLSISAGLILAVYGIKKLSIIFEHYFNHSEREKQKLS